MKSFVDELGDISFVIFYGSQLGQAKSIAEGLAETAEEFKFKAKALELNVIKDVTDLTKLSCPIVVISSSTGDGEPPENADKFWRKIRRKTLSATTLQPIKYTLLGLGDTNYNNFCGCPKEINKRFQDLGASLFYPVAWADDAVGLDLVVEEWIDNLWSALEELLRPSSNSIEHSSADANAMAGKTSLTVPSCPAVSLKLEWLDQSIPSENLEVDLAKPLFDYPLMEGDVTSAKIKRARVLTTPSALKTSLEFTLEFAGKPFKFEPGDAVNIVCQNSTAEVNHLLERLKLTHNADKSLQLSVKDGAKGKIPPFLPATVQLRSAFLYYLDIRSCPKKTFLRLLAEYTTDDNEKSLLLELCSRQGSAKFEETVRFPGLSLLDLLLTFPSCMPPLEALLEHLPRLLPRAYSISSSPLVDDKSFTFVFNVVTFSEENGRKYPRLGVATGWLYQKAKPLLIEPDAEPNELVKAFNELKLIDKAEFNGDLVIYKRKNHNFRLPENLEVPILMVGPGTGVAPFIGFIQHREEIKGKGKDVGENFLYFGCRNKAKDFLYEEELSGFTERGILTKFYPVFSRDNPDATVKYVQHRMEENKEEVVSLLLDKGGFLYVCGDAKNMAKDVRDVLIRCIQSVKGVTEAEAKTLVTEISTQKRYLQDVWT